MKQKEAQEVTTICGFNLRDYFAAAALTGLLSSPGNHGFLHSELPYAAYDMADRMLKERRQYQDGAIQDS